jgi:phenylalanyl-tRNA synthetase beta chain
MPVIGIPVKLLTERLEGALSPDELVQHLQHIGCDVEGFATLRRLKCTRCGNIVEIGEQVDPPVLCRRCGVDYNTQPELRVDLGENHVIRMELLAVRPDMFDPGGLARTLRGYLEQDSGSPEYELGPVAATVRVDPAMATPACPRSAIACAVVHNVVLDDDFIKELMNLQENLHWALGRDRKHASIGVYDLAATNGRSFRYRPVGRDELRFVPLGYDPKDPAAAITPGQVLEEHPKGVEFARLLAGFEAYPLLEDTDGQVLSMPPIINSEQTRVTDATTSFFIDVTGTNRRIVSRCLNVLVTSLIELQPSISVQRVSIDYGEGDRLETPDFAPQVMELSVSATSGWTGIPMDAVKLVELLNRMGHDVEVLDSDTLEVSAPAYRNDLMNPVDLMEDAAIAFGYHNIVPTLVPNMTVGGERPIEGLSGTVRACITGLGWAEVMTLVLTSEEKSFDALQRPRHERYVSLAHPISRDQTMLRTSLAAGLLETLTVNGHNEYPQRIFEVGETTELTPTDTGASERRAVGGVAIGERIGATEVRAVAEATLRELGWGIRTANIDVATYLPGRGASIWAVKGEQEIRVGELGELHPAVLEAFRLKHPAALFEIDLTTLTGLR